MAPELPPTTVLIVLGSNIEPRVNLPRACRRLGRLLAVAAVSGVYESEAHGAPGTPPFLNAAVRATTRLEPAELRRRLRRIEAELGRRRSTDRNAPRPIDLDIALYGRRIIDDSAAGLRIPDPEILERPYLARPLADVGGELMHPVTGESLAAIARRLAQLPGQPRRVLLDLGRPPGG